MTSTLVHITLLGLIGSALAQNNGIYSTGFPLSDSAQRAAPSRLASARLLQSFSTTSEAPQFVQPEEQYYEEKPSLRSGPVFRIQPQVNSEVYQSNQESIIPRRQPVNQFYQSQDSVAPTINYQQTQEPNIFISEEAYVPAQQAAVSRVATPIIPRVSSEIQLKNEKERLEQNKNAKYSFNSVVSDTIFDNSHVREEVRDGLKLAGLYSYSDGFFKRTTHYVADENGYRVIKEDVEPIGSGEGPLLNPNGQIDVAANYDGAGHNYHATAKDIPSLFKQEPSPSKLLAPPVLKLRQ